MTKKEMFARIATINAKDAEIVAFCEHEIELLSKKGSGSHKPTKTQLENEGYKRAMLETLAEVGRPLTISELMDTCPALAGLKNQRVSALMTQLKNASLVVRTEDKKKAYFSIAEKEAEDTVQALPEELSV